MDSVYVIDIPNKDYLGLINDIVRMSTIHVVIQILYYINSPGGEAFLTLDFVLLLLYIVLGVCVYWLVIKKLVSFK
jgi:hypothetical protein